MSAPVHRVVARVLPVSATGEVPMREPAEEAGVVASADVLSRLLPRGDNPVSGAGVDYVSDATFFALPLDRSTPVTFEGLEPAEVGNVLAAGWWTPDALRTDGTAASTDLPDIMDAAIAAVRGET